MGVLRLGLYLGAVIAASAPATADDFFKGKTISLMVGTTPGQAYDAYARLLARHMGRHIPANPSFVVMHMPGASGRRLITHMYNAAPKDGTTIGTAARGIAFDPLMGSDSPFDPTKVSWIGSANNEVNVCFVWHTSPIRTFEDLKTKGMVVGTTGPTSTDTIFPNVMNYLLGTKIRIVAGYKSASETHIAIERGEVDGRCGISWDTLQALNASWLEEKKIRILVQFGLEKHRDLPDVPSVMDLAKTEEERQILMVWTAPNKMGRPFFGPPAMDRERLEILRRAFDATLKDPALLAEVEKTKLWVDPMTGKEIEGLLRTVYATPKDVVARAALAGRGN